MTECLADKGSLVENAKMLAANYSILKCKFISTNINNMAHFLRCYSLGVMTN